MAVQYRTVADVPGLTRVARLEQQVWGADPIPIHQTLTAVKNGGLMIVAEDEGEFVGFVYGFPGVSNGQLYLCSHMMGVDNRYRNQGIGFGLKIKQAEMARGLGFDYIKWTYDPLESRNAYLNLSKLGAYSADYIVDCYGGMEDTLNQGLPTDRLNVTWRTTQSAARDLRLGSEYLSDDEIALLDEAVLLKVALRENGWPYVDGENRVEQVPSYLKRLFIPIPNEFQSIKRTDLSLALEWRMATRQAFLSAFSAGWVAVDIFRKGNGQTHFYVLQPRE